MKYLTGLLLTISLYFILALLYCPFLLSICLKNDCRLIGPVSNGWLDISTCFFCSYIFIVLTLIAHTKNDFKKYLQTIILLIVLLFISLIIHLALTDFSTNFKIDDRILNQVMLDYRLLYFSPTIALIPVFVKQLMAFLNIKSRVLGFKFLSHVEYDIRIVRFLAKVIDIVLVILLSFFFSKIIKIHPDMSIMTLFGSFLYIFTIEYSIETSIGKMIFGLKVISTTNNPISGFQIFIRTIARLIPLYPLGILLKKDGLHDYISQTKVIKI